MSYYGISYYTQKLQTGGLREPLKAEAGKNTNSVVFTVLNKSHEWWVTMCH